MAAVHALPPAVHAPAGPAVTSHALEFRGARIGMSLAGWKALPRPGPPGHPAEIACRAEGAVTTCAYVGRYGRFTLPESFDLAGRFRALQPTYWFRDGRLTRIQFQSSIDGFEAVMARLKARFGAPAHAAYDSVKYGGRELPRVQVTWKVPGGVVRLVDPAADPSRLAVRLEAAGAADAAPAL